MLLLLCSAAAEEAAASCGPSRSDGCIGICAGTGGASGSGGRAPALPTRCCCSCAAVSAPSCCRVGDTDVAPARPAEPPCCPGRRRAEMGPGNQGKRRRSTAFCVRSNETGHCGGGRGQRAWQQNNRGGTYAPGPDSGGASHLASPGSCRRGWTSAAAKTSPARERSFRSATSGGGVTRGGGVSHAADKSAAWHCKLGEPS